MRNPFGPLAWWELRRLGRNRRLRQLRVGYVLTLLVVQFLFFLNYFAPSSWSALLGQLPLTIGELSRFGSEFHDRFILTECLLLFVIVPILFIEPLTNPRDREMLDLLRSSPLSNFELLIGLALPRFAIVVGLIVSSWPILALTTLYGGIGLSELAGWQLTLISMTFCWGTIGLHVGIDSKRRWSLYGVVYCGNAVVGLMLACLWSPASWETRLISSSLILLIATGEFIAAWRHVRTSVVPSLPEAKSLIPQPKYPQNDFIYAPPIDERDPWIWKEQHFPRRFGKLQFFNLMVQIGLWNSAFVLVISAIMVLTRRLDHTADQIDGHVEYIFGSLLIFGIYFVMVASVRTSLTVVREREQRTLETLLCLPVEPKTILSAKWWAAIYNYRLAFAILAGLWLMGGLLASGRLPNLLGQGCQFIAWLILMNTLALWLSVRSRTSASAMIQLILCGIASLAVPPLLAPLFGEYAAIAKGMSFATGWGALFDNRDLMQNLAGAGIGSGLSLLGAFALWRDACRRIRIV